MDYFSVLFYSVWGTGNQVVVLVVHTLHIHLVRTGGTPHLCLYTDNPSKLPCICYAFHGKPGAQMNDELNLSLSLFYFYYILIQMHPYLIDI